MEAAMTDEPIPYLQEKVLAGSLLTSGAGKAASVIDSFVSWLLAGAGGALALLIGSLDDLAKYVPLANVKSAAILFLVAACLTVVEKYLTSIIVGAAETSAHAAEVGRRLADDEIEIDFTVVFRELEAATLPPMRWFVGRSFAKAQRGDFAASGRNFARCAQIQGVLALAVAVLVLSALGLVVCALGG
jgi:hypothetical protein